MRAIVDTNVLISGLLSKAGAPRKIDVIVAGRITAVFSLDELRAYNRARLNPRQAWGGPTADSDIDLLVILGASEQPCYRRAREVYRSLRGLRLPIEVLVRTRGEVTRAARFSATLERQALDHGRVLHG